MVATFAQRMEAEVARSLLETAGIDAWIHADDLAGMLPLMGTTSGGVTVLVGEEDVADAVGVLGDLADADAASPRPVPSTPTSRYVLYIAAGALGFVAFFVLAVLTS